MPCTATGAASGDGAGARTIAQVTRPATSSATAKMTVAIDDHVPRGEDEAGNGTGASGSLGSAPAMAGYLAVVRVGSAQRWSLATISALAAGPAEWTHSIGASRR